MAVYEMRCPKCEVVAEVKRRIRDRDNVYHCEACGNVCERQMSTSSFHLKGGCWAKDGYVNRTKAVPPGYGGKK